ncbi:hypothetical protein B0H13DRAFT_1867057 [Mycena leptocephala]|nr:hypothetical protein B0H13DRAFT_1867057 [Mycena leptocephala]
MARLWMMPICGELEKQMQLFTGPNRPGTSLQGCAFSSWDCYSQLRLTIPLGGPKKLYQEEATAGRLQASPGPIKPGHRAAQFLYISTNFLQELSYNKMESVGTHHPYNTFLVHLAGLYPFRPQDLELLCHQIARRPKRENARKKPDQNPVPSNTAPASPLLPQEFLETFKGLENREWDSFLGEELPDTECTESQPSIGDEENIGIATETALDLFTKFLVDAQTAAQNAERQREQETGRKRRRGPYTGQLNQSKWRDNKKAKKLEALGFVGLGDFLKAKAAQKLEGHNSGKDKAVEVTSEEAQETIANKTIANMQYIWLRHLDPQKRRKSGEIPGQGQMTQMTRKICSRLYRSRAADRQAA